MALIAAGVIVFGSLAAYVAFNGLPVDGGDDGSGSVAVESSAANASAPANAGLGAAPGAVAATPAAATAIAPPPGTAPDVTAANGAAPGTAPGATGATTAHRDRADRNDPGGLRPGDHRDRRRYEHQLGPGAAARSRALRTSPPTWASTRPCPRPPQRDHRPGRPGRPGHRSTASASVVGNPDLGQQVDNVTDGLLGD